MKTHLKVTINPSLVKNNTELAGREDKSDRSDPTYFNFATSNLRNKSPKNKNQKKGETQKIVAQNRVIWRYRWP